MTARKASSGRCRAAAPVRRNARLDPLRAPTREPNTGRVALLLFFALLVIYVCNFRLRGAGDSIPTRLLPFSILREGNVDLDEFAWRHTLEGRLPYYVHWSGGHIYSVSTIATPILITPLYIVPVWLLSAYEIPYEDVRARVVIVAMERLSAAGLTALSASLLFVILCGLVTRRWALALAVTYALGTTTWVISSQALWPHALSQLTLVIMCAVFIAAEPSRWALLLAGVCAATAVANRPQTMVFALPALVFVWKFHRRHLLAFVSVPVIVGGLLVWYNTSLFRGLVGAYGHTGLGYFSTPLLEGLAGLLFSPNRGLFLFTPIMVFAAWGGVRVWRVEAPRWIRFLVVGLVLHVLLYAKFDEWWAGYTYGPRYFTDVLPVLTLLLVYGLVPLWRRRGVRVLAVALALYGMGVQAIGVYCADDSWDREPIPLEQRPERVWDWSDLQILRALGNGWRGAELAPVMIDAFLDPVPARLVALAPADLASELQVIESPSQLRRGVSSTAVVRVANRATRAWPAFSGEGAINVRYRTYLMARWFSYGRLVKGLGDVVPMPENLAPGEVAELAVPLVAPPVPGMYEVEFMVTQAVDGRHGVASPDALRFPLRVE